MYKINFENEKGITMTTSKKIDRLIEEGIGQWIKDNPGKSAAGLAGLGALGYGAHELFDANAYSNMAKDTQKYVGIHNDADDAYYDKGLINARNDLRFDLGSQNAAYNPDKEIEYGAQVRSDNYDESNEKSLGLQNKVEKLLAGPQTVGVQAQLQNLGNDINTAEANTDQNLKYLTSYNDHVSNPNYVNTIAQHQIDADNEVKDSLQNFNKNNDRVAADIINDTREYNNNNANAALHYNNLSKENFSRGAIATGLGAASLGGAALANRNKKR